MGDIENVFRGKGLVNEGVYASPSKTVAKGYTKPWWNPLKGLGHNVKGKVLEGIADPRLLQWSKNMFGQDQIRMASNYANQIFNRGKNIIGPFNKIGGSTINKYLARFLPGAQQVLGAASAADYLSKGQNVRAGLAGLSMAPGLPGWAGLAGEAAVNVGESIMNKRTGETGGGGGKDEGPSEAQQRFERSGADTNRSFTQTDYGKAYRYGGIVSLL